MCGICGKIRLDGQAAPAEWRPQVQTMMAAMAHRGPNGEGLASDEAAVLGFVRLAIRALTDGRQPMVDPETGVMAVCNGEIDNHQALRAWLAERGKPVAQAADVAVIPALYQVLGEAFAERLEGAFAIALWDPGRRQLLLARDRTGERPLFFIHGAGEVGFASQIAALAGGHPAARTPDVEALHGYLQSGYFSAPASPMAGVRKVLPGEVVALDATGISRRRYWRWPESKPRQSLDPLAEFDGLFTEAVRLQSEVDVDFGLFLSGGVDSSLIAAVARKIRPGKRLQAYTLRFGEASYDEGAFAEQVAGFLGVESIPVWVRPEDFPATLAELIRQSGEPLADPAWVPTALLSRRAAQDVRVALSGEGADELFGGYPTYFGAGLAEYYARLPRLLRGLVRDAVEHWPPSDKKVTLSFLLKRFVQGDGQDPLTRHRLWTSSISSALLERLLAKPKPLPAVAQPEEEMLHRLQRFDLENALAEALLTKADRASMASALELRAPFLNQAVMDFAAALPEQERVKGLDTKVFLKRYALNYLPRTIVHRKKRGLSIPLSHWLRGPLRNWARAKLGSPLLEQLDIKPDVALALLDEHDQRRTDHARALWALIVLSEWLDWVDAMKRSTIGAERA